MIDSSKASDFQWDRDVCVFFETIKYLGGQRTRNFVRGPGFHGTGRGGRKEFTSFSDFVTSAEVTFMMSVDNSATMPVGVHYHPKSVTGEEMLSQIFEMAKTVQVCERCLTKQSSNNHVVTHETAKCNSTCVTCLDLKVGL